MLDRCASCILCKREALPEAMRSVGRVGVRAAQAQKVSFLASVLRALARRVSFRGESLLRGEPARDA